MHRIPARGFDDPRFDGLQDDDRIHVLFYWPEPLDDATLDRVGEVAGTWLVSVRWTAPESQARRGTLALDGARPSADAQSPRT